MTDWKRTIDLQDAFLAEDMEEIASICFREGVPRDICESMLDAALMEDQSEFNYCMSELYDWADENEVWVKTLF